MDYSKWDKFCQDMSSDSEGEDEGRRKPTVTRLEGSGRVEIGPDGASVFDSQFQSMSKEQREDLADKDVDANLLSRSAQCLTKATIQEIQSDEEIMTRNGCATSRFSWSQDKDEVIVMIPVTDEDRAKDIRLSYELSSKELSVVGAQGRAIVGGVMKYSVETNNPAEDECPLDWEVSSQEDKRYVMITLKKKSPIPGAVQWWTKVLNDDEDEVDVLSIADRKRGGKQEGLNSAWKEAHQLFQEKIRAEGYKVEVDVNENEA